MRVQLWWWLAIVMGQTLLLTYEARTQSMTYCMQTCNVTAGGRENHTPQQSACIRKCMGRTDVTPVAKRKK